jgi:hypothetical protein
MEEMVDDNGEAGKGGMKLYSLHCQNIKYHWSNLELFVIKSQWDGASTTNQAAESKFDY